MLSLVEHGKSFITLGPDLKVMSISQYFSAVFTVKVNEFLFGYQEDRAPSKRGLLIRERICSYWSKFFPLRVDP